MVGRVVADWKNENIFYQSVEWVSCNMGYKLWLLKGVLYKSDNDCSNVFLKAKNNFKKSLIDGVEILLTFQTGVSSPAPIALADSIYYYSVSVPNLDPCSATICIIKPEFELVKNA